MLCGDYNVKFNYISTDLADENYGVLQEGNKSFDSYISALSFSRQVANNMLSGVRIIGLPYIEPILDGE